MDIHTEPLDYMHNLTRRCHTIARERGWATMTYGWVGGDDGQLTLLICEGRRDYRAFEHLGCCYATRECVPHRWDDRNTCTICNGVMIG